MFTGKKCHPNPNSFLILNSFAQAKNVIFSFRLKHSIQKTQDRNAIAKAFKIPKQDAI